MEYLKDVYRYESLIDCIVFFTPYRQYSSHVKAAMCYVNFSTYKYAAIWLKNRQEGVKRSTIDQSINLGLLFVILMILKQINYHVFAQPGRS